jgi:His-Xaa-Ser system protein HxsD
MRISVSTNDYTQSAILAAVKKQQVFADWVIEERSEQSTIISFAKARSSMTDEECERRFRQQLDDEMLREKLEHDFGAIRDLLVSAALSPIIRERN